MRRWHSIAFCLLALIPVRSLAGEPLDRRVESVLQTSGYANGHWGLLVIDAKTGATVYERNADHLFRPASVTKLYSTSAAWVELGPDHRFKTPIVRRGQIREGGRLAGDLILVAQGDFSLGGRSGTDGTLQFVDDDHTYANGKPHSGITTTNPLAGLEELAQGVSSAGIKEIDGDVKVDARLFEETGSTGSGPSRVSPIMVNDNLIDVILTPGVRAGEPASVKLVPETRYMEADVQVDTVAADQPPAITIHTAGPRRFAVRGKLPVGHRPVLKVVEVDDPASFARTLLIEALSRRGIRVKGSPLADNAMEGLPSRAEVMALPRIAEHVSAPLSESIRVILKVSHNLHASTLPLLLAVKHGEKTQAEGLKVEGRVLRALGVHETAVSFGGGAGGARADLATPRATVTLLQGMARRPDFARYEAALPVLGRDGTLVRSVSATSPARGKVRAKTGTYWVDNGLDGQAILTSKALAGYLDTASGRRLTFAFFVNEVPLGVSGDRVSDATAAAGRLLGKLCETFYDDAP
ncbi:MAG: D-alanyl-D-alanine carboxypeptidase/D-alanyl-D-alanine-endopeptidase [Isosphaeraceae bacterium]